MKKQLTFSLLFSVIFSVVNVQAQSLDRDRAIFAVTQTDVSILSGDVMHSIYANKDRMLFGDFMADGATDNTFLMSPGIGYRTVEKNQLWGAYFFGDYERVSLGENFWVLSPGVEWMSSQWDLHINGYFPTQTSQSMSGSVYADKLGMDNYATFEEGTHNQYNLLVTPYDVIGQGVDAEIGYSFAGKGNLRSRVYVGGYYYQPPTDFTMANNVQSIPGITAGYEQPLSKNLSLSVMNSYDQVSLYTVGVSIKLTLGGESNVYSNQVRDRLWDPVQRHVGIIGTGAGTYDQEAYNAAGRALEYDNIYFMSPGGEGDGTYGRPMGLNQAALDSINAQAPNYSRIYIEGGKDVVYAINAESAPDTAYVGYDDAGYQGLLVYNGQDFYGRSSNYTMPAKENERPIIAVDGADNMNGFIIQGGENTLDTLNITTSSMSHQSTSIGVLAFNTGTSNEVVNIAHTYITGFNNGMYAENSQTGSLTLNASYSHFNENRSDENINNPSAYGLLANSIGNGSMILNVSHSQFNNNAASGIGNLGAGGLAISSSFYDKNHVILNVMDSQFNNNTAQGYENGGAHGLYVVNGFGARGSTTVNIANSQFNHNTSEGVRNAGAFGFEVNSFANHSDTFVHIHNAQFDDNRAEGESNRGAYGFSATNGGYETMAVDITRSQFNHNTVSGTEHGGAYGLYTANGFGATGNMTVSARDSQFNQNMSDGLHVENTSPETLAITDLSGSHFNNNGAYGIYAIGNPFGLTMVDYAHTTFFGNAENIGNGGNVIFIPNK